MPRAYAVRVGTVPSAFPDAANTGPIGALTTYSGSTVFSTPGQTISNQLIQAPGIDITANNVTFSHCKIVYTGTIAANPDAIAAVFIANGVSGTQFIDCEIDGRSNVERAIKGYDNIVVRRCHIHHAGNGVEVATAITVEDSYLHDIVTAPGTQWHADGIQPGEFAVSNVSIRHNTILLPGGETAAVNFLDNSLSFTYSNILIDNNLMAGGSYTVYMGAGTLTNVRVTNNRFSTRYFPRVGDFNIWHDDTSRFVCTGNVIHETGVSANNNNW